jgi:hypothetical protein
MRPQASPRLSKKTTLDGVEAAAALAAALVAALVAATMVLFVAAAAEAGVARIHRRTL